ncbi:MAG TPA: NAD+ synthase [Candidatus Sulfotelmatobacter sp.]|nr:NAD+ synthase [Candidatus Sulfotelmatobacter sp.]
MSSRFGEDPFAIREPVETVTRLERFLTTHLEETGARCLVLGMSGGLDSSVTAALCARAVGRQRVLGICLPENETRSNKALEDTRLVASKYRIRLKVIDITPIVEASRNTLDPKKARGIPWGNVKARLRAMVLYYFANTERGLVVGTGDKSEIMLGYFTKFGDGACDILPLADLYKTSVRNLARHLGIPERIRVKASSPELWPGQTAEKELGLGYEKLDRILWGLERWMTPEEIVRETGLKLALVRKVRERWLKSEHKRRPPLAMKLGYRTAGSDLRLPQFE